MSKQEARLPEKMKKLINDIVSYHEPGCKPTECHWATELQSAILLALDEARDEALERAAELVEHPHTSYRRIELADKIRALKSKHNLVDKPSQ